VTALPDPAAGAHATMTFLRDVAAAPDRVWAAWSDPAARAAWSSPGSGVTVDCLEAGTVEGGREVSVCRSAGDPDIRCEVGWIAVEPAHRTVNTEVLSAEGRRLSAALVTATVAPRPGGARLTVVVQLANLGADMRAGYSRGFPGGLDNLVRLVEGGATDAADRTLVIERIIAAPVAAVRGAWADPAMLPRWWGPDGFSCRTTRIDLRAGGEWVFDMIGPDGTVWPNHHRYTRFEPGRIDYTLYWGEGGPKHADASATFVAEGAGTRVTLSMTFVTPEECAAARGFGAVELGLQTLAKLARQIGAD
jgi:uncharacterized protein YndB with AHSA1/START domain